MTIDQPSRNLINFATTANANRVARISITELLLVAAGDLNRLDGRLKRPVDVPHAAIRIANTARNVLEQHGEQHWTPIAFDLPLAVRDSLNAVDHKAPTFIARDTTFDPHRSAGEEDLRHHAEYRIRRSNGRRYDDSRQDHFSNHDASMISASMAGRPPIAC
jgi:hypothetical protein